jgi:hypothetical protein
MPDNTALNNPMVNFMMMQNPALSLKLQQQQALAQELMREGSEPSTTPQTAAGGMAIQQSPLEGLAKALEKGAGGYIQANNNKKLAAMLTPPPPEQQMASATNAAIGSGEGPAQADSVAQKLAAQMQPSSGSGIPSVTGDPRKDMMLYMLDPSSYAKGAVDQYAMTPEMKLAHALHPEGGKAYLQALQDIQDKNAYITPENVRTGSVTLDPKTGKPLFNNTAVPDNTTPVFGTRSDGTQGTVGAQRMPILPNGNTVIPSTDNTAITKSDLAAPPAPASNIPAIPPAPQQANYLPVGPAENAAATDMGKNNSKMVNDLRATASDSPVRQDVYDKILNLSKAGVSTGGGAEMYNNIKNYAVNTPLLGPLAEKLTGNPGDYQELSKFLQQNAMRTWQAAGGTGTDAQLEASMAANPNTKMSPTALQAMAQWGKAGEMALNAKNNFIQKSIGPNNENIANANQLENEWKQHFDPKVYQMALTGGDPKQLSQITANMTPAQKTILMGKYQYAKQNGWLQ